MFIKDAPVAITADGPIDEKDITPDMDVIWIKPKMDVGTEAKVLSAVASVGMGLGNGKAATEARMNVGAWNLALLQHNIVKWAGPSFKGAVCNQFNIAKLDPSEPLVKTVQAEINARNKKGAKTTDPKSSTSAGASDSKDGPSSSAETSTSTSSAPEDTDGAPTSSID